MPHFLRDLEVQDLHTVDHASLAQAIAKGIELAAPPFRIALFGSWGSGKSTILKMVQACIEEENAREDLHADYIKPLWFNAWEVESHTSLLASLVTLFVHHIPEGVRYSRKGARVARQAALASAYLSRRWNTAQPHPTPALNPQDDDDADDFSQVQTLKDTFRRLVDLTLQSAPRQRERRLVVFVDDLDKCAPHTVLAFIEGVKLFLERGTPLILVFALDREVLGNAIAQKYHHSQHRPPNTFDADRYVEKIFEFNYDVPPITLPNTRPLARELYLRAGLADLAASDEERALALAAIERALALPGISLSPRKIKRIFNKFIWFFSSMRRLPLEPPEPAPASPDDAPDDLPALDAWLIWLLTTEQWRELRRMVADHGAPALGELCNRVTGNPLFPHANQTVRALFDALPGQAALLDYYRGVFNANGAVHLPAVQLRMRARVHELARIDRVLLLNGV